jgi:hypothetical protein
MGYGLFVCLGRCSGVPAYGLRGHLRAVPVQRECLN